MKKIVIVALLALAAVPARANPYFRTIFKDGALYKAEGALVDPVSPGQTAASFDIAIVHHSPKDGCLLASICEDWSPLAVGGGVNAGRFLFFLGPSANMTPIMKAGALWAVNGVSGDGKLQGLKSVLSPSPDAKLTLAISPKWAVAPSERWKGYFKLFVGPAWHF